MYIVTYNLKYSTYTKIRTVQGKGGGRGVGEGDWGRGLGNGERDWGR